MKKYLIMLSLIILTSCAGVRKTSESNSVTKSTHKTEIVSDSTKTVEINKLIDDAAKILVTKSDTSDEAFNAAVDKKVDEILSKLNLSKQSGDNNYSLIYDQLRRELIFRAQVGETKSETEKVNKSEKVETSFEQTVDTYISKKVRAIPWWLYAVGVFWFLPQIIERATAIVNPIRAIVTKKPS